MPDVYREETTLPQADENNDGGGDHINYNSKESMDVIGNGSEIQLPDEPQQLTYDFDKPQSRFDKPSLEHIIQK